MRNALAYAGMGQRQMVLALIITVFAQETAEAAHAQWRVIADQLREKFPKLSAMLDEAEHDVLAFMDFPKAHRKQIASTNPLERVNAEVKRRTDVVGIFTNDPSIVRLVGALMLEQNDEWQLNFLGCGNTPERLIIGLTKQHLIRVPSEVRDDYLDDLPRNFHLRSRNRLLRTVLRWGLSFTMMEGTRLPS